MIYGGGLTAVVDKAGGEGFGCREATAVATAKSIHGNLTTLRNSARQSRSSSHPAIQCIISYLRVSQVRNLVLGTGAMVAREKLLQFIDALLLRNIVIRVGKCGGIVYSLDLGVCLDPFGDGLGNDASDSCTGDLAGSSRNDDEQTICAGRRILSDSAGRGEERNWEGGGGTHLDLGEPQTQSTVWMKKVTIKIWLEEEEGWRG